MTGKGWGCSQSLQLSGHERHIKYSAERSLFSNGPLNSLMLGKVLINMHDRSCCPWLMSWLSDYQFGRSNHTRPLPKKHKNKNAKTVAYCCWTQPWQVNSIGLQSSIWPLIIIIIISIIAIIISGSSSSSSSSIISIAIIIISFP